MQKFTENIAPKPEANPLHGCHVEQTSGEGAFFNLNKDLLNTGANNMENLIKNTIITQVITLGFDFEQFTAETELQEVEQAMLDFFHENSEKLDQIEDECEVTTNGHRQHVSYGDFESDGEIVDFSSNWSNSPDTKVFHSHFVMEQGGVMKNMSLYYLVGETEYNAAV